VETGNVRRGSGNGRSHRLKQGGGCRGRVHVRFHVRIGVRFAVRFAANGIPQVIFLIVFAEMCGHADHRNECTLDEKLDSYLACVQIVPEIIWGIKHEFVHM
jgi:hypothetical protein